MRTGRSGALVHCDTEPRLILFGPGLDRLWRPASREEASLWARLSDPVAVSELRAAGYERGAIEALLDAGALEYEDERFCCEREVEAVLPVYDENTAAARHPARVRKQA